MVYQIHTVTPLVNKYSSTVPCVPIDLELEHDGCYISERKSYHERSSGRLFSCASNHSWFRYRDWHPTSARENRVELIQDRRDGRIGYPVREFDPLLVPDLRIEDPRIGAIPVDSVISVPVPEPERVAQPSDRVKHGNLVPRAPTGITPNTPSVCCPDRGGSRGIRESRPRCDVSPERCPGEYHGPWPVVHDTRCRERRDCSEVVLLSTVRVFSAVRR